MSSNPYDGSYDSSDPQSFNRYVYARNNPLTVIDPSGLSGVCVSAFPYGNAEEPYVDPSINNSADCASAYGTWVETGSDATMDVSSTDPVADPGNGAMPLPLPVQIAVAQAEELSLEVALPQITRHRTGRNLVMR